MPVTSDIAATYRGPRRVMRRLLKMGPREDRALALLIAGCAVAFISSWPGLQRKAFLSGEDLNPMLGGALLGWLFIAPLLFYAIALFSYWIIRLFKGAITPFGARLALFWAFLAASPVMLLNGLVAGFIGPGLELNIVGALWVAIVVWFWVSNLREAGWEAP